ncbi:MAG TPA: ABC transporter ATP-binding protein [Dehalococcoidia bacterium]|nr:ABC transporter ATP-binding protein [Dehalococcoidia bacterium]
MQMHGGGGGMGFNVSGSAERTGGAGSAVKVSDDEILGKAYDHSITMRLARYILPFKKWALITLVAVLLYTGATVTFPMLVKWAIDSHIKPGVTAGQVPGLTTVALIFLVVALVHYGSNFLQAVSISRVGQGVLYTLRTQMFNHLQTLSLSFYRRTEVGRIMSRMQNDILQLQETFEIMVMTLADILSLGGIVVMMLILDWKLALITFSVIPVLFFLMAYWQRFARRSFLRIRRAIALVNGALQENIAGVRVVQSLNRQERNLQHFESLNREHRDANINATLFAGGVQPLVEMLTGIATALVIVIGGWWVVNGWLQVGVLVAFVLFIQRFFDPIRNLTMQYTQLQRSMASGVRIFELLDVQPEVTDKPGAAAMPPIKGHIKFENVDFAYKPGVLVLQNVNIEVQPGETVALVGPTGAGKTTTVSLVSRFYDVTAGRITIDGHDVRDVTRESLVGQMSMVLQEPFLVSAMVKENIRYCRIEATDEQVVEAAKAVGAHDFIMRLEHGYDTVLRERGSNLSIGQRQLISFARAIVANPRILILDEATANVDTYTEMLIQEALKRILEGRTSLVIAHRLSTIRNADRIVVLDHGRVVEQGNHWELLRLGGLYAHLYAMNYGDEGVSAELSRNGTSATVVPSPAASD